MLFEEFFENFDSFIVVCQAEKGGSGSQVCNLVFKDGVGFINGFNTGDVRTLDGTTFFNGLGHVDFELIFFQCFTENSGIEL